MDHLEDLQCRLFHDWGFLVANQWNGGEEMVVGGPGAIIVSFIIEFVIALGCIATLLFMGVWDGMKRVGVLINDIFMSLRDFLVSNTNSANLPDEEVVESEVVPEQPRQAKTEMDLLKILNENITVLDENIRSMNTRLNKLETTKKPTSRRK